MYLTNYSQLIIDESPRNWDIALLETVKNCLVLVDLQRLNQGVGCLFVQQQELLAITCSMSQHKFVVALLSGEGVFINMPGTAPRVSISLVNELRCSPLSIKFSPFEYQLFKTILKINFPANNETIYEVTKYNPLLLKDYQ